MNINFSAQTNNSNCSFGKWKRITISKFDDVVSRATNLRHIMELSPGSKVCFQTGNESGFDVTHSLFAILEYIQKNSSANERTINVFANHKMPRKVFNALKSCLQAYDAEDATRITKEITNLYA